MHLDLRNFYGLRYLKSLAALARLACALVLLVVGSGGAVADTSHSARADHLLDRSLVEACYHNKSLDMRSANCVGKAAEKCSTTPPFTQSTMDIWTCYQAEATVWDEIAAALVEKEKKFWREPDPLYSGSGIAIGEAFEALIVAERSYREAMCRLIYAENAEGSMKNIYAARCSLEMASSWVFKLREKDWYDPYYP